MTQHSGRHEAADRDRSALAEAVRRACLEAATAAAEEAGIAGLCAEGRLERALDAIRTLDLDDVVDIGGGRDGPA